MIKFILAFAAFFLIVLSAYANGCTTQTIETPEGKLVMCQTCCSSGNCVTTCF